MCGKGLGVFGCRIVRREGAREGQMAPWGMYDRTRVSHNVRRLLATVMIYLKPFQTNVIDGGWGGRAALQIMTTVVFVKICGHRATGST
jgi:hypothetical protein